MGLRVDLVGLLNAGLLGGPVIWPSKVLFADEVEEVARLLEPAVSSMVCLFTSRVPWTGGFGSGFVGIVSAVSGGLDEADALEGLPNLGL